MVQEINCRIIEWKEIHKAVNNIVTEIKREEFNPDYVIAIARGGVVPARLICDELMIKNFISIKADHWGITANKDGKAVLSHGTNVDLKGKRILLVDDITDTGESMQLCKDYLEDLKPSIVKTAALYHLTGSKFSPDYSGAEEIWTWMVWPWNYKEDMVNLITKLLDANISKVKDLQEEMSKNYKINLEQDEIMDLLDHIDYLNSR
jgi:hypoxanthine phosphoribosyltransferase